MTDTIAGVEVPATPAGAQATEFIRETTNPLIFHHSRRVFLFASLHARRLGLGPHPELLYISAMFHDAGLLVPFSKTRQRFELDGADHARAFLLERGFSPGAAEAVWLAVALHTTPGVPGRMGPEIAATNYGVLTDAIGWGLDEIEGDRLEEIVTAHPRGDLKKEFLEAFVEGLKDRPDTTYGTINADVLEHFVPDSSGLPWSSASGTRRGRDDAPWPDHPPACRAPRRRASRLLPRPHDHPCRAEPNGTSERSAEVPFVEGRGDDTSPPGCIDHPARGRWKRSLEGHDDRTTNRGAASPPTSSADPRPCAAEAVGRWARARNPDPDARAR